MRAQDGERDLTHTHEHAFISTHTEAIDQILRQSERNPLRHLQFQTFIEQAREIDVNRIAGLTIE